MPVPVSYPGVYIEEAPSGVHTITGVSTSIAAFMGRAVKGPPDTAVRCFGFSDFVRSFGSPHPQSDLYNSVRQFFDNGGTDCYIVRLAPGAHAASIELTNWATSPVKVLQATAKVGGQWGNGVRLEVDYNTPNPGDTFNLGVIQEEGGRTIATELHQNLSMDPASARYAPTFVKQSSRLIDLTLDSTLDLTASTISGYSEARRPLGTTFNHVRDFLAGLINFGGPTGSRQFDISVNGSDFVTVNLKDWDVSSAHNWIELSGQLQNIIKDALSVLVPAPTVVVTFNAAGSGSTERLLRITADSADKTSVRIRRASASDISASLMLGVDNGGIEVARYSEFRPAPNGTVLRQDKDDHTLAPLNAFLKLKQQDLKSISIGTEVVTLNDVVTGSPSDPFYRDAFASSPNGHSDGIREKLRIIARAISNDPNLAYNAEVHGYQLVISAQSGSFNQQPTTAEFTFDSSVTTATADLINQAIVINTRQYTLGTANNSIYAPSASGEDGTDGSAPVPSNYFGDPVAKTGFYALDRVDLFNLLVLPADAEMTDTDRQNLWGPASIYCQSRRAFLLIDAPDSWTASDGTPAVVQDTSKVNDLRARVVKDYSAVFYPKIKYNSDGMIKDIGPSGAIAGLMARTDASRGVWKAPAGTEADLRGIAGLDVKLTDLENGVLNKLGVNCLRNFPSGFVNWGARTLDGSDTISSDWKYIPIRRLALFIEESLYRGTKWVVFEPNDEPLWAKIRLNVGVFMNGLFRQGAFQGSTPDKAFYVKCDSETTTQADRNLGIVNIEVGFAPLKPAEFVVITIQQIAGNLQ